MLGSPRDAHCCPASAPDPLGALDRICTGRSRQGGKHPRPHPGPGWIAILTYELGAAAEPTGFPPSGLAPTAPAWTLLRLDNGLAIDRLTGAVHQFGDHDVPLCSPSAGAWRIGSFVSTASQQAYERAVNRTRAYIHAGDIFQSNLAHRLVAPFTGDPRTLAAHLMERLDPRWPCYAELPGRNRTIISLSPELFLHIDRAAGRVLTRPIKGTGPAHELDRLDHSSKDAAELAMIVDLMRNDLGRVAKRGSVRVDESRRIELHHGASIAHTVATVSADLPGEVTLGEVLEATMPPGSVTGAPKVRALQIIEALERPLFGSVRGAYCGALGYIDDDGNAALNVGIRTLTLRHREAGQGEIDLPVGAGIVADSAPHLEWLETLAKATPIAQALGASLSA